VALEEINDIVHVVTVVDGSPKIIEVDIEIEILVNLNSVEGDVIERARLSLARSDAQPFGLLILRDYGENLYLSDLYRQIRENQENDGDIQYMNIKINGPLDKLDSDGNLIISRQNQEIIQPGNIVVRPILRETL
jgi:hypothetical protein